MPGVTVLDMPPIEQVPLPIVMKDSHTKPKIRRDNGTSLSHKESVARGSIGTIQYHPTFLQFAIEFSTGSAQTEKWRNQQI